MARALWRLLALCAALLARAQELDVCRDCWVENGVTMATCTESGSRVQIPKAGLQFPSSARTGMNYYFDWNT
eukprot:574091-Rhodomonas_salina.2